MSLSDYCRATAGVITALALIASTVAPYEAPQEPTPIDPTIKEPIVATHPPEKPAEEEAIVEVEVVPTPTVVMSTQHIAQAMPATPAGTHQDWLAAAGITEEVWGCADTLIRRESGWRVNATNPSSGAYGIPQALPGTKMASAGADWQTNPITQLRWMAGYVQNRYGGFCQALEHSNRVGWY